MNTKYLTTLFLLFLSISACCEDVVVATVNDKPILLKEIQKSTAFVRSYILANKIKDEQTISQEDVERVRLEKECKSLSDKIFYTLRDILIAKNKIDASEDEISQHWALTKPSTENREEVRKELNLIREALEDVYTKNIDSKVVYENKLKGHMLEDGWAAWLRDGKVESERNARLNALEKALDQRPKHVGDSVKYEKMDHIIEADLQNTDPEFKQHWDSHPKLQKMTSSEKWTDRYYVDKRTEWWRNQMRHAKIILLMDKYNCIWSQLKINPPSIDAGGTEKTNTQPAQK